MQSNNKPSDRRFSRLFASSAGVDAAAPVRFTSTTGTTRAEASKASSRLLRSHLEVVGRTEAGDRPARPDGAVQAWSEPERPRRSDRMLAVIRTVGGFAARSQAALADSLLAAMSWTIAQILAGCAEYCQAMYPTFVEPEQSVDSADVTSGSRFVPGTASQLQQTAVRATVTPLQPTCFSAADAEAFHAQAAHLRAPARSQARPTASRGWRASTASPVLEFWLRLRQEREIRREIVAPRVLDGQCQPTQRAKYRARRGEHRE